MKHLNNAQGSISTVRQLLQQQSADTALKLSRSVSRATSVDLFPCTEYGAEVKQQHRLSEELLFLQHCRAALERGLVLMCFDIDCFCFEFGVHNCLFGIQSGVSRKHVTDCDAN